MNSPVTVTAYTVGKAIEDGVSLAEELLNELQDWYDNMPESLQGSSKGDALQSAIDTLGEGIAFVEYLDLRDDLSKVECQPAVMFARNKKRPTRGERGSYAAEMLRNAATAIDDAFDSEKLSDLDDLNEIIEALQDAAETIDSVEWPGMYS